MKELAKFLATEQEMNMLSEIENSNIYKLMLSLYLHASIDLKE